MSNANPYEVVTAAEEPARKGRRLWQWLLLVGVVVFVVNLALYSMLRSRRVRAAQAIRAQLEAERAEREFEESVRADNVGSPPNAD